MVDYVDKSSFVFFQLQTIFAKIFLSAEKPD